MKIKHTISILFMILLLASCKNGLTIFDQIDQETKLEDAVITGSVNSIVRSGDTLYASDGNIYSKSVNDIRGWSKIAGPGGTIIKLAADTDTLYALTQTGSIFGKTGDEDWEEMSSLISAEKKIKTIFSDGEYAFYEVDNKFYNLDINVECSCVPSSVLHKNGTHLYYAKDGKVYGTTDNYSCTPPGTCSPITNKDLGEVSVNSQVYSLTYSAVDKAIYAGTNKGLKKLPLNDTGKLTGEVLDPPGNWAATINDYEAFAVLATGTTRDDSALYSSTIKEGAAYAKINGLWGYYYNRRNNWNRE